ncbi:hypothetical protein SLEP1_g22350 [Rubroshorea leprosula]|uniref:Uncharacterized protein n=1 Tax=Rubroshorea leprosula TaxID=152421 RepID=A0AAV5J8X1_9ROSI|nr:hypothetical protein SLEP1_g22350 [Rubroshorea leprosula]
MIIILFPFLSYFHKLSITAAATRRRKGLSSSAPAGLASVLLITFAIRCLHVYDSLSWGLILLFFMVGMLLAVRTMLVSKVP